ncbi:MAG: DNA double-strand break repair nuclease NurA [Sulfolobales archaeon]|nr:DNA double-strand break repair nuclease NurA [Sulfolobales archaeon]
MESQVPREAVQLAESAVGVAPELIESALESVVRKVSEAVSSSILGLAVEVRRKLLSENRIGRACPPRDYCYLAVDSSYTSPSLELLGGYLGFIFVASVTYGKNCRSSTGPDVRAYLTYNPTRDLTTLEARKLEKELALEVLKKRLNGELHFDVLVIDGDVVPRISPRLLSSSSEEGEIARKLVDLADSVVLGAEKAGVPVVGVLKRSYSKDALAVLKHYLDTKLSDRAFMTYVLEPNEFFIIGDFESIASAYRSVIEEFRSASPRETVPALYRYSWLKRILERSKIAAKMKMALYRPSSAIASSAVKVEYYSSSVGDEELLSSLIYTAESTGFPAPVDYADALTQISSDFRYTVYQVLLQKIGEANPEAAQKLFSLANPQKLGALGLRT